MTYNVSMADGRTIESVGSDAGSGESRGAKIWAFARKTAISLFFLWQVFAVSVWLMPPTSGPHQHLTPIVRNYMLATDCDQGWTMFAPNPTKLDVYVQVVADYGNGTQRSWNFPRPSQEGYIERYQAERMRKMIENAQASSAERMWPFLARYAAIQSDSGAPGTYPMTVHLIRHARLVPPPPYHEVPYSVNEFYSQTFTASPLGGLQEE